MNEINNLYHSPLFEKIKEYLVQCKSDDTIFLFVPYIKTNVLEKLLDGISNEMVIVTTWKPQDIQSGSSEITLYPFCKQRRIALYVSEDLHLKVYSIGLSSAVLATGNVSRRGLYSDGNYEAAVLIEQLTVKDRLFFERIRMDARLVSDVIYENLKKWSEDNTLDVPEKISLQDIISLPPNNDFLISALPMTRRVDDLIVGYQRIASNQTPSEDSEIAACVFHDLINYDIPLGLLESEFKQELSLKFFAHPFIQKIDEFIAPEAYFGRIKEWIQNNCTDVPVPSRREMTGNVQVLLEWFEVLGGGKYVIDIPGSHSQRIKKL